MKKKHIEALLKSNKEWAAKFAEDNPGIFEKLSNQQSPQYLWIGCSDSRIPANAVMGLLPGEVFVHRNIGNLVHAMDINCHSVIQFAVEELKVSDIIIGGHYDCGAIKAALSNRDFGMMNNWLRGIKDVYHKHAGSLIGMDEKSAHNRMCELNVIEQVRNISRSNAVQRAWAKGQSLAIHGMIYGVHDGRLHDLNVSVDSNDTLENIYKLLPNQS
ncbi:carbonate dehydratase [Suttonella ornithocola]|uniref:Carbonic anhydrase n=1 Tax=Suttonella ornithocola TaxID=279832 RepID=A0A380MTU0_9GAMM|nr:carbonate dehydratase [Suttonella ornithocola]SUO95682.1 Carbonic anhydrase 2 [Suttonella ornithocola]